MIDDEDDNIVTYKVILIGDSAVGKTAIINRFSKNDFSETHITTIGVDFGCKSVDINGTTVKLQLWDTAGQERFQSISKNFYRGAHAIVVVYAIDDEESFRNIRTWLMDIEKETTSNGNSGQQTGVVKYLVGNKADLNERRVVDKMNGMNEAEKYGIKFMETSAKDTQNVEELFTNIARDIVSTYVQPIQRFSGPLPEESKSKSRPGSCC